MQTPPGLLVMYQLYTHLLQEMFNRNVKETVGCHLLFHFRDVYGLLLLSQSLSYFNFAFGVFITAVYFLRLFKNFGIPFSLPVNGNSAVLEFPIVSRFNSQCGQ